MGFDIIKFCTNVPGEIPVEIVVAYFAIALVIAFILGKRTED